MAHQIFRCVPRLATKCANELTKEIVSVECFGYVLICCVITLVVCLGAAYQVFGRKCVVCTEHENAILVVKNGLVIDVIQINEIKIVIYPSHDGGDNLEIGLSDGRVVKLKPTYIGLGNIEKRLKNRIK